jgi:hypothetical protein
LEAVGVAEGAEGGDGCFSTEGVVVVLSKVGESGGVLFAEFWLVEFGKDFS